MTCCEFGPLIMEAMMGTVIWFQPNWRSKLCRRMDGSAIIIVLPVMWTPPPKERLLGPITAADVEQQKWYLSKKRRRCRRSSKLTRGM